MTDLAKPSYSTSKAAMRLSGVLAWALIFIVVLAGVSGAPGALALAPIVLPSMVAMIDVLQARIDHLIRAHIDEHDGEDDVPDILVRGSQVIFRVSRD